MATPDAGGPSRQPQVLVDTDSDSDSVSSSGESSQRSGLTCPWRTARYHDRECSRYFDCPSHVVERALSDTEEEADGTEPHGRCGQEDVEMEDAPDRPEPASVSPLSEDGDGGEGHSRASSSSREPEAAPGQETHTTSGESPNTPGTRADSPSSRFQTPSETGTPAASSAVSVPRPTPRGSSASGPPAVNVPATSPAPATRLISRPSPTVSTPSQSTHPSDVVLPRWQPDSEVTYCPICGTQFSIFVRKHHCRKCGRVVCASCSPHRITIPHQYIVRPPGAPRPLTQGPTLSLLLDNQGWYPEFGGGERVRLCNPCVPDPNIAPPQSQGGQARSPTELSSPVQADSAPLMNRWGFYFGSGTANDAQTRSRSATMQPGPSSSSRPPLPPHRVDEGRILWGTPPAYYRSASSSQTPRLYPGIPPRYRSMLDVGDRAGPSSAAGPSSSSASASRRFHSPVVPRPQIAEEDECPVCHRELPPRTLPNFESLREAHINSCIASHSRYGGPATTPPAGGTGSNPDMLPSSPPRRTGLFPYTATEKDCVDSAECSICLEEFEVGVAMARLECLCRFHRACINAWWERHPGRCPMHQHDGFGY